MPIDTRAGYEIYHREMGEGAREALFLHCSLAHSGAWKGLSAELSGAFHMVALDHLSHGQSAAWSGVGDYHDASTEVAKSFLQDAPIDLVGHSFGATVALRIALEAPEKVRSLVLIEPVLFSVAKAASEQFGAGYLSEISRISNALERGDSSAAARAFLEVWGGGQNWDAMPAPMKEAMAAQIHVVPACQAVLFDDVVGLLKGQRLEALTCPVLMLRGALSPDVMGVINDGLAARLPNAQSVSVAGAGHMVPITHPKETAGEMRRFFRKG